MDTFSGTLTLDDGARVPVDVGLDDENLVLRTDGREIGIWPIKYCRVSRSGGGAVILSLDGEKAVFEPEDVARFSTIAAQRFRASSLADRIEVIRDVPFADASGGPLPVRNGSSGAVVSSRILTVRHWVVVGLVAAGSLAGLLALALWPEPDDVTQFAGTTITLPSPELMTPPPLFDQTLAEFTSEWNLTATAFGVPVQIRGALVPGQFESQLTRRLTLQGRTDADGTVGSLLLVIDPGGDTDEDETALAALGVAIAVANPELTREERGEVLAAMGLSVRNPDLAGLDGDVRVGSNDYSLAYFAEFDALLFSIAPV